MWKTDFKVEEFLYSDIEIPLKIDQTNGVVYWIKTNSCKDILIEGYVGITTNFSRRLRDHKSEGHLKKVLQSKIKHYGWVNLDKVIIFEGTLLECLKIELYLRPKELIGWNICKGGGYPPLRTPEERKCSAEKACETRKNKGFYNFKNSQKRNLKVAKSKRESGYFTTERHRESHRKSRLSVMKNNLDYNRPVGIFLREELINSFESYYALADHLTIPTRYVQRVIKGQKKSVKGFVFKLL